MASRSLNPWVRPTQRWMDAAARRRFLLMDEMLSEAFDRDENVAVLLLDLVPAAILPLADRHAALAASDRMMGWLFDVHGPRWKADVRLRGRGEPLRLAVSPGRDDHVRVGNPSADRWAELPVDLIAAIRFVDALDDGLTGSREPRRPRNDGPVPELIASAHLPER